MLCGWGAGHCHATEGKHFCWQHHSRTQELSCLSVCSFSCANKQPSAFGSHSASSGSPHAWHHGFWHSSWVLIPCSHHQHHTQEAWSFLQQCIWWPMWQEGSHQNQERVHWQWWLQIQCQNHISPSGHWACYNFQWRWQRARASSQYWGCWAWPTWLCSQTQQCQQWVQSSTCPAGVQQWSSA